MVSVKFDHRVKYAKVWHPAHTVFEVDDRDVPELKKLGCQVLSYNEAPAQHKAPVTDDAADSADEQGESAAEIKEKLLEYTVNELIAFAEERGIDLQGKTRKADIFNIIVATL